MQRSRRMALAGVVLLLVLLGAAGGAARLVAQQPADSAQPAAAPANAAASDAPQPAQGEALRAQRDRLAREARALMDAGKRPEALAAAEQMLAIQRQLDDAAFSPWGDWIAWAAGEHEAAGRFESALRWRQEGVELCRRLYGERAWQTTDARLALQHARRLQQLAPHQRQALAKADAQQQQVIQLHGQGQYARAIPLAAQVLEVRQQLLGEEHPHTATSLNNLAALYDHMGDYARAAPLYQQALAIRKKVLGEEHPDTATSLNNLGYLYRSQGDYARAAPLYQQALAIRKKVLGEEHPDTATSLNNLGYLYRSQGDYARAEPLYQQALAIFKKVLGEEHPDTATSLNNLGYLYQRQGDYARAEPLYQQALAIRKKVLGEEHPHTAGSLNNLALLYVEQGDYARAEPLYQQALAIRKKVLGEEHPHTAGSLHHLGYLYQSQGDYARAEPLYQQALAIRKKVLGEEHPDTAISLHNLGYLYQRQGDYARAEPLYQQALAICKKVLGEEHPDTATSLNNLAGIYRRQGDYARAEPLYQQALAICKKVLGEEHPHTAGSLHHLGYLYQSQGDYARAEPLYQQALAICKKVLGEEHPDTATSLNNLAGIYVYQGDYARAAPLYQQALAIRKKVLGEEHPDTATSLNNLAVLYVNQGDYARAEPLYQQALAIRKKVLGEEHPDTATSLNNLAGIYQRQGDYARAEPLYQQALAIFKKVLGEEHPDTATSLNNLAGIYVNQGDYARAEPLYQQALAIFKKVLGEEHPDTAGSLHHLGYLYQSQGDYARAEPLYQQALAIRKKVLGEEHPDTATSLNNLAGIYVNQGDYARAEPLYQQALAIFKKVLGEEHPDTAISLHNLGLLQAALGRAAQGLELSRSAVRSTAALLETTSAVQSERQQLAMAKDTRFGVNVLLSLAHLAGAQAALRALEAEYLGVLLSLAHLAGAQAAGVYADVLPLKGQVLLRQRAMRQLRQQAAADPDSPAARAFLELADRARQLDRLAKLVPRPEQLAEHRRELQRLTQEIERLQQALAAASVEYRRLRQQAAWTPAELAAQLPHGTALVDVWRYQQYLPPEGEGSQARWEWRYVAFVLRPARPPAVVWLGAAEPIEQAVETWRGRRVLDGQVRQVAAGTGAEAAQAARTLRQLVWDRLAQHLGGVQTVLVCPDGALHGFPLAALPGSAPGSYLLEDGPAIVTLAAPLFLRELLHRSAEPAAEPSLLAVGDVDYGADPGVLQLASATRGGATAARSDALWQWPPLDNARVEVREIDDRFSHTFRGAPAVLLREKHATEQAVREHAPRATYLHLATHGFFAPEKLRSVLAASRTQQEAHGLFQREDVSGWHPGLLSGIVLAGANRGAEADRDDGILTALEVAELDLSRVEMVVLSACETGLGATAGGEGLLGLQRAFQLAGARSTVATLWQVPDQAARALMVEFYDNLWKKRLPRAEALRQAQLAVMKHTSLRKDTSVRGADPLLDDLSSPRLPPWYWAAFILSGDWR